MKQASLVSQIVNNMPAMWETWVQSLGWEDHLEKGRATHSSIPAWGIPWTEEPGSLQSMESQRVGYDWATFHFHFCRELMGLDAMILVFWMFILNSVFHSPLSPSSRGPLVPLHFLPLECFHLHIWGWYLSQQSRFQLVLHPAPHFTWCTLHRS